jgi:lysyl-tRNA synthetase class 2
MTRELIQEVADEAIGTRQVPLPDGTTYDLDGEWLSLQMYPSLSVALGEEITPETPTDYLLAIAEGLGIEIPSDRGYGHGKLIEELWEHSHEIAGLEIISAHCSSSGSTHTRFRAPA